MWTVVYMAQNKDIAQKLQVVLEADGVLVKIRPVSKKAGENGEYYEVLVPESEVGEAHNIIIESGF